MEDVRRVCGKATVVTMDDGLRVPEGCKRTKALIAKAFPTHPIAVAEAAAAAAAEAAAPPSTPRERAKSV